MNFELTAAEAIVVHEALMSYMNHYRERGYWPTNELRAEAAERLLQRLDGMASHLRPQQMMADDPARLEVGTGRKPSK